MYKLGIESRSPNVTLSAVDYDNNTNPNTHNAQQSFLNNVRDSWVQKYKGKICYYLCSYEIN